MLRRLYKRLLHPNFLSLTEKQLIDLDDGIRCYAKEVLSFTNSNDT